MAEATLPSVNGDGKRIGDDIATVRQYVEEIITVNKNVLSTQTESLKNLKSIDSVLIGVNSALNQMLDFMIGRADIEDRNRQTDMALAEENRREAQRARGESRAGAAPVKVSKSDLPELGFADLLGLPLLASIVTSIFGSDDFMRVPAYLTALGLSIRLFTENLMNLPRRFAALAKLWNNGTRTFSTFMGKFLTGGFFKPIIDWFRSVPRAIGDMLKKNNITKVFSSIFKGASTMLKPVMDVFKGIGSFFGAVGRMLKPIAALGGAALRLLGKLALPITIIFGIIDGITGFVKEFAATGSIVEGIKGALVGIVDGFFGTLAEFLGDALDWILNKITFGLYDGNLFGSLGEWLSGAIEKSVRGMFDVVVGIFTLDWDRIKQGLGSIASIFIGEDGFVTQAWEWVKGLFTWSDPNGEERSLLTIVGDALDEVWNWLGELFDPKRIIRAMLPDPSSAAAILIPNSLYEYAGINPETGEVETPAQRNIKEAQDEIQASQERLQALEAEREAPSDMEGQRTVLEEELVRLRNQREEAPVEDGWFTTTKAEYDEMIADREARLATLQEQVSTRQAEIDAQIAEERRVQERAARRITGVQTGDGAVPEPTEPEDVAAVLEGREPEQRRGAVIPPQSGEQVVPARGTGEVTPRGAMAIPGAVQVVPARGTGEVTPRGAMAIPGAVQVVPARGTGEVTPRGAMAIPSAGSAQTAPAAAPAEEAIAAPAQQDSDGSFRLAGMDFGEDSTMNIGNIMNELVGGGDGSLSREGLFAPSPLTGRSFNDAFAAVTGQNIEDVDAAREELFRRYQGPEDFSITGRAVNNGSTSIAAAREERMSGSGSVVSAPTDNSTNVTNVSNQTTVVGSTNPRSNEPTIMATIACHYDTCFG